MRERGVRREPKGAWPGRGAVVVSARLVAGMVGVALTATMIAAATWLPIPTIGVQPPAVLVTPVAAMQQRVCPGPLLRLGDELGQDATVANSVGRADVVSASTRGETSLERLATTDNSTGVAPDRLTLPPAQPGEDAGILAGSQSQRVQVGELAGFAAARCAKAASESWLIGGSTTTGRTTLITLSNPSNVSASVDLTVFTETGVVEAAGTRGIIVPPSGQRILSLAGFAPGAQSPVVRVVSAGGQVVAQLQQSIVRTLTPGGVDLIGAAGLSTLNVIPGLVISAPDDVEALQGAVGNEDLAPVIRMLVPGTESTEARITVISEDGATPPSTIGVHLEAGVVTELPFGDFAEGSYTVSVETDVPAVAGVRASVASAAQSEDGGIAETDFAWFAPAPQLDDQALVSVAPGPSPQLHLANPTEVAAQVSVHPGTGADTHVTVAAGGAIAVPLIAGERYTLSGFETLYASVSYHAAAQLAGFAVGTPEALSRPITVFR